MNRLRAYIELWWLRWCLDSDERWVRDCAADGILTSRSLAYIREDAEAKRVRIAVLEQQLRPVCREDRRV